MNTFIEDPPSQFIKAQLHFSLMNALMNDGVLVYYSLPVATIPFYHHLEQSSGGYSYQGDSVCFILNHIHFNTYHSLYLWTQVVYPEMGRNEVLPFLINRNQIFGIFDSKENQTKQPESQLIDKLSELRPFLSKDLKDFHLHIEPYLIDSSCYLNEQEYNKPFITKTKYFKPKTLHINNNIVLKFFIRQEKIKSPENPKKMVVTLYCNHFQLFYKGKYVMSHIIHEDYYNGDKLGIIALESDEHEFFEKFPPTSSLHMKNGEILILKHPSIKNFLLNDSLPLHTIEYKKINKI